MREYFNEDIIDSLKAKGIDINNRDYKESKNYANEKNELIFAGNAGVMTVEEYIERYLIPQHKVTLNYDSIYDMGNNIEPTDNDCLYETLAAEIIENLNLVDNEGDTLEAAEFAKRFNRQGGIIDRLKKYLNFDIELFDRNNIKYKFEICKIIYLFYILDVSVNLQKGKRCDML